MEQCYAVAMKITMVVALVAACGGASPTPAPTLPTPAPDPLPATDQPQPVAAPPVAVGKPKADLIPRNVVFGNPERTNLQISPDGKSLSWLAPKDGVLNVWVAPINQVDDAKVITNEKTRPIRQYFWAFTNKHILYMQDAAGDENFHMFRVDLADSNKVTDLTPSKGARTELAWIGPQRPTKLLVQINDRNPELMDVVELDLATGKRTMVVENDGYAGFTLDHDGKVRFAEKRTADGGNEIYERDGKGWKLFDKVASEDAETTTIAGFSGDNKTLRMLDARGRDTVALIELDLKTKQKKVIAEDPRADVGDTLRHPTKYTIEAVSFEYDRVQWKIIDKSVEQDLAALAKLDAGSDAYVTGRSLDDKTWIVVTTSEQHPGRYYHWDRAKQQARFLFALRPDLERQPLAKMHPVVLKSRDGLNLVSYLSLPVAADPDGDGKPNAPVPMVLYVHGGPWARDSWGYEPIHQLLANRGYAVLSVNYRGSTGFGKKFLNAANLEWGRKMHNDLIDAVEWAVKSGISPRDKIAILGGSYGGYATLVGMTMTPDVFACGVDLVGVSNLETFIASIPPYWAPYLGVLRARIGNFDTVEGKQLLRDRSPVTHAANIKRPLLIGQGANDPRVKQAESEQIVAAMQQHKLPVSYVVFPDEGHGFARPENNIAFFATAEAFLSVHLGGYYQPISKNEIEASSMQIKVGRDGIPGLP